MKFGFLLIFMGSFAVADQLDDPTVIFSCKGSVSESEAQLLVTQDSNDSTKIKVFGRLSGSTSDNKNEVEIIEDGKLFQDENELHISAGNGFFSSLFGSKSTTLKIIMQKKDEKGVLEFSQKSGLIGFLGTVSLKLKMPINCEAEKVSLR